MRRTRLLVFLLLLAVLTMPVAPELAHSSQPAPAQPDVGVQADFNQDGFADLAIGAPFEAVGNIVDAGAVNVLYGTAGGLSGTSAQLFTQVGSAVEPGDFFGRALASGDFNNDGFADLAAAAPSENVGNIPSGGAVSILYGSAGGLTTSGAQLFTQDSPGVPGVTEPFDFFGLALTADVPGVTPAQPSASVSGSAAQRVSQSR